jgi:hypothetical protein
MTQTTLQMVLDKQEEFQTKLGFNRQMDLKETIDLIHTHSSFINEEVIEMLRELPYHKPWRDYSDWDAEKMNEQLQKAREEWIDVFIFLSNVGLFLGLDENKIREMYLEKLGVNHERQENPELGYIKSQSPTLV